jgi:hypothetical protein
MKMVKTTLAFGAMSLVIIAMSGSDCNNNATATCQMASDQSYGTADCNSANLNAAACAAVQITSVSGAQGPVSACEFTAGTPSCTVNVANEATACGSITVQATCAAAPASSFCTWVPSSTSSCVPVTTTPPPGFDSASLVAACAGLSDATSCNSYANFCTYVTTDTSSCNPISTTAPTSGADFAGCAAAVGSVAGDASTCNAVTVGGTSVCYYATGTCAPITQTIADACAALSFADCLAAASPTADFCDLTRVNF